MKVYFEDINKFGEVEEILKDNHYETVIISLENDKKYEIPVDETFMSAFVPKLKFNNAKEVTNENELTKEEQELYNDFSTFDTEELKKVLIEFNIEKTKNEKYLSNCKGSLKTTIESFTWTIEELNKKIKVINKILFDRELEEESKEYIGKKLTELQYIKQQVSVNYPIVYKIDLFTNEYDLILFVSTDENNLNKNVDIIVDNGKTTQTIPRDMYVNINNMVTPNKHNEIKIYTMSNESIVLDTNLKFSKYVK